MMSSDPVHIQHGRKQSFPAMFAPLIYTQMAFWWEKNIPISALHTWYLYKLRFWCLYVKLTEIKLPMPLALYFFKL